MSSLPKRILIFLNSNYNTLLKFCTRVVYRHQYKRLAKKHHVQIPSNHTLYTKKWAPLHRSPHLKSYGLFSKYIGDNPAIAPEDISASIILPILNPIPYRPLYSDKNMFEKIVPPDFLPKSILRSIKGCFYGPEYSQIILTDEILAKLVENHEILFLKPSVDTNSGFGVIRFKKDKEGNFRYKEHILSTYFLQAYQKKHPDFIVQEGLTQHPILAELNPSSINTFRIATYRSVKDNKVHILHSVLRIGKKGSYVDNSHSGGMAININDEGELGKILCDPQGNLTQIFNDIDFANEHITIPCYEEIKKMAIRTSEHILHHRLIALDICLTKDGTPKLIEYNLSGFAVWLFQFLSGPAFGEYTDEIIEYCSQHKHSASKLYVDPT